MGISRRAFIRLSSVMPWALRAAVSAGAGKAIPVGLELYSVREELAKDPKTTVRAVAGMGYQCVEFYAPYFQWTDTETKDMRKLLDDLGVRCFSTHNDSAYFAADKLMRARDLNSILGSRYMVMASAHPGPGLDGWKKVADTLNDSAEKLESSGIKTGYHNHQPEFRRLEGQRPMEILAKNTKPAVMLQLDVGTCVEAGSDPVDWIKSNPGRIRSVHCKDWSPEPDKGYKVLFGEGAVNWKNLFAAAETVGGVEFYLVEQEGSRFSELETVKRCLEEFRKTHPA